MAAAEKLHVVKLGKQLAGAGWLKPLKLGLGLLAEVLAIDEEQDACRA